MYTVVSRASIFRFKNDDLESQEELLSNSNRVNLDNYYKGVLRRIFNDLSRDVRKNGLRGVRQGPTQTGLCSHRRWFEAWNFGFRKKRKCTIQVAKTKALISFAVTAKLICVFVFAYAKIQFSHVAAHPIANHNSWLLWRCLYKEDINPTGVIISYELY